MGITAATIESNGWVLAVTGDWPETEGAWEYGGDDRVDGRYVHAGLEMFALEPDGEARLKIEVVRQGFVRSAGLVVPSVDDRETLVATKALRRPYPNQMELDEVAAGGVRTLRFALSDRVYAGDVVTGLVAGAGWRRDALAQTFATVGNLSARALPVAISRWAQPSYTLVQNTDLVDIDVVVAAPHPRHFGGAGHQGLAAIQLRATDGVTTKQFWFLEPRTSTQYGDDLRCWGGRIDLSGLNPGPISIHRTEYPWIGAARSTGEVHSTDAANAMSMAWGAPLVVCYDPTGTLYTPAHVFVDALAGTTIPEAVTVGASLAAARSGVVAADISTAVQAICLQNRNLPARNGWPADTARAMDWAVITLSQGVSNWGATSVNSGAACNEGRLVIRGDPEALQPRASCIWRTTGTVPSKRVARFWLQDLTVEAGEAGLGGGMWHLDNVEVRGKPGFETATTGVFTGTSSAGYAVLSMTRTRWWQYGAVIAGSTARALLLRNCEHSRGCEALVHIHSRKIEDPYFPQRDAMAFGTWGVGSFPNSDAIVWGCSAQKWSGRFLSVSGAKFAGEGTYAAPDTIVRFAAVNSFCERSGGNSSERIWGIGETAYAQMQDCIFEGLTMLGNGWNAGYNDSPSPFLNLQTIGNVVRNNVFGRHAIKQDIFKSDGSLTGSWEYLYGVGFKANVHGNLTSTTASNFQFAWFGLNSAVDTSYAGYGTSTYFKFRDDRTDHGPEAPSGTGMGDYTPELGSPLLGRVMMACVDRDIDGQVRPLSAGTAGAMEAVLPAPQIALIPENGVSLMSGPGVDLVSIAKLQAEPAVHALRAEPVLLKTTGGEGGAVGPTHTRRMIRIEGEFRIVSVFPE